MFSSPLFRSGPLGRFSGLALLILAFSCMSFGQGLTAVTGRVTDPTGAIIPGVEITITNTATGNVRTVLTNELGVYTATQLAPGTYNIKAELAGFKPKAANNIALPVDQTITLNLPLEVGAVTDVVDVTASAEVVNTENAQLGAGFDSRKILDLPLNARNIVGLLSLQTGVSVDTGDSTTSGYVNGARNDQQNIVLDGVDNNRQQAGSAFTGALPTTLDSVQEFIVQTSGQSATSSRSSGAQVQLVTKSGSNQFHGSAYEAYRSKVTTATPYFSGQATPKPGLIRNIPGGSVGGPIVRNKLFFFGAYERRTDRSQSAQSRNVPNPTYLQGTLRYQRKSAAVKADGIAYGTITTGCGGMLEKITQVPCDTVNPALFGPNGYFQQYAKYTNSGSTVCPSDCSNLTSFKFNAPNIVNNNVYISRFDYNINSKNTVYVRGTLNDAQSIGAPTFPDINNGLTTYDNSKGFSASLNSVISPTMNNNFTAGLTREAGNSTGAAAVSFSFGPASLFQTNGASRRAIDTWNFVDNLSWIKGAHSWTGGVNFSFVNNNTVDYGQVSPGSFSSAANYTVGDFSGAGTVTLGGALGADFANVSNVSTTENDVIRAIGGLNLYSVGLQWDKNGNLLPVGTPFQRIIRLDQYDFYLQDSWKMKSNLTLNYGLHWGVVSPPWEKNGNEVNWVQSLGYRYTVQKESPYTADQLPLLTTELAGRANGLPDYYPPALNNFAPRVSFAYSPKFENGILGDIAHKGGQMVIRGGYALTFDHTGGRLATDAAASGGIGLFTSKQFGQSAFSIDGAGKPALPRVGGTGSGLILPYNAFTVTANQSFTPDSSAGGWAGARLQAIDNLRPPSNHLLNLTVSKELPGGLLLEASYVGRFARGLFGVLDLANPVNVVDQQSGMDYYTALKTLFETYENNGVGGAVITTANAAAATASIKPIPWFESVYGGFKDWAETGIGPGVAFTNGVQKPDAAAFPGVKFANATQAFYAVLNKGLKPGPNTPIVLTNATQYYESDNNIHITTNPQAQYESLYSNIGWSNYNSGQFSLKKRFGTGYSLTGNYTWSKSLDVTSAPESLGTRPGGSGSADQLIDPYHPEKNYGPSTFDRRHQFNGNFQAELPFGTGKLIGGNVGHAINQIIGGWAVSGIFNAASGSPYSYHANLRYTMHYNGLDNPIPTAPIEYGLNHGSNSAHTQPMVFWIKDQEQSDTCDAVCAAQNRSAAINSFTNIYPGGPVARNYARGPGFYNLDASLSKTFTVTEKITGRFSADAFNVLNHPSFSNPSNVNIDSTSGLLGNITSTVYSNRVMQFNVRLQF
jgi:Carboxypeptidase regulatory-like domain